MSVQIVRMGDEMLNEGTDSCVEREKHWEELTADEKIERLMRVVKMQHGDKQRLQRNIQSLLHHCHSEGIVCVSIEQYDLVSNGDQWLFNEKPR